MKHNVKVINKDGSKQEIEVHSFEEAEYQKDKYILYTTTDRVVIEVVR